MRFVLLCLQVFVAGVNIGNGMKQVILVACHSMGSTSSKSWWRKAKKNKPCIYQGT